MNSNKHNNIIIYYDPYSLRLELSECLLCPIVAYNIYTGLRYPKTILPLLLYSPQIYLKREFSRPVLVQYPYFTLARESKAKESEPAEFQYAGDHGILDY